MGQLGQGPEAPDILNGGPEQDFKKPIKVYGMTSCVRINVCRQHNDFSLTIPEVEIN